MTVRIAINGFGRIGRLVFRAAFESLDTDIEVVAINDLGDAGMNALLLARDSVHGRFPGVVKAEGGDLFVNGHRVRVIAEPDPAKLPWGELGIDVALECTGRFVDRESAAKHLAAGAGKVLVSAPAKGSDLTVVYGVNHERIEAGHKVVSNASCTTNCLAPVAKVLHETVGIEHGFMTTVHSYTGDQRIVDTLHKDPRRARAGAMNMIPTSTGAARAVGLVLPELAGKLDGAAVRVPTPNVSLVDLKFRAARETAAEEINAALAAAAEGPLRGILQVVAEPSVSSDYNHDSHSSSVDLEETRVIDGRLGRVLAWYDNEWGFSNRMLDTAAAMARAG